MWSAGGTLCGTCGAGIRQDFVFCHSCGTELDWREVPAAGGGSMGVARKVRGLRTRRGLAWCAFGLILYWIPGGAVFGALFLSYGGYLVHAERKAFGVRHAAAVRVAYVLLWLSLLEYILAFGLFFWQGYSAYLGNRRLDSIQGDAQFFALVTTAPTLLLTVALALEVRHLLGGGAKGEAAGPRWKWALFSTSPEPNRSRQVLAATILLTVLVLVSTAYGWLDLESGLGNGPIRIAAVLGVLNRISFWRLIQAPAFVWFAYLYVGARGSISLSPPVESVVAPQVAGPLA